MMPEELRWTLGLWAVAVALAVWFAWRQRRRRIEPISRNLPVVAVGMIAALFVMVLQASRIQVFQQRTFADRTGIDPESGEVTANARLVVDDTREMRGSIRDVDRQEIAWSEERSPFFFDVMVLRLFPM